MSDPLFLDELDPKDQQNKAALHRLILKIGVLCAALVVIGYSIWYFYPSSSETAPLPVIHADATPIRIEPEEEGGMNIAHQDSTIYNTFQPSRNSATGTANVENLLDSTEKPETPVSKEKLFAGLKPDADEPASIEAAPVEPAAPPANIEIKFRNASEPSDKNAAADVPAAKTPQNLMSTTSETTEQPDPAPAPAPLAEPEKTTPTPPAPKKAETSNEPQNFFVQLASIQDEGKTPKAWQDLQQKYGSILESVSYRTQKIDIENKGTFYRVQGGPLTKDAATKLCEDIKIKGGSCFIVQK